MADKEVQTKIVINGNADNAVNALAKLDTGLKGTKKNTDLLTEAGQHLGGLLAGVGVASLAKQAVEAGLQMERLGKLFTAAAGSANLAARELDYVRQVSNKMGLDFLSTAESYGKFMASIKGTAIEGEKGRKVFEGVSTAVTALSLNAESSGRIFAQLQQMMSKGKVTAEDLNVVAESLPGVRQKMAEGLGVTTQAMADMMSKGKLLAENVLPALGDALLKAYGSAAAAGARSAQAEINRLNNEILITKGIAGAALIPVFTDIVKAMRPALGLLQEFIGGIQILAVKAAAVPDVISAKIADTRSAYEFMRNGTPMPKQSAMSRVDSNVNEAIDDIIKKFSVSGSDYTNAELISQQAARAGSGGSGNRRSVAGGLYTLEGDKLLKNIIAYNLQQQSAAATLAGEFGVEAAAGGFNAMAFALNGQAGTGSRYRKTGNYSLLGPGRNGIPGAESFGDVDASAESWYAGKQSNARAAEMGSTFIAMQASQAGSEKTAGMMLIDKEEQYWRDNWAMKTSSLQEYEARNLQITEYYAEQRDRLARIEAQRKLSVYSDGFNRMSAMAEAFHLLSGKKSKAAFKVYQALKSGEAVATTASSAIKAWDAGLVAGAPYMSIPVAAAYAGASIAMGAAQIAAIWSASPDGGGQVGNISGGSSGYSGPGTAPVTQPLTSAQTGQAFHVTMQFNGTTLVDEMKLTRWTEDVLIPSLRDLKTRGVTA